MNAAARVDNLTRYIEDKLIENKLQNRVNVIYLSDHGMVGIPPSNFIDLTVLLANDTYDIYGTTPVLQIVPKDKSKLMKVNFSFDGAEEIRKITKEFP